MVDKEGKVLAAEAGGPAATVDVCQRLVGSQSEDVGNAAEGEKVEKEIETGKRNAAEVGSKEVKPEDTKDDKATADVAADVADTAEALDGEKAAA